MQIGPPPAYGFSSVPQPDSSAQAKAQAANLIGEILDSTNPVDKLKYIGELLALSEKNPNLFMTPEEKDILNQLKKAFEESGYNPISFSITLGLDVAVELLGRLMHSK